MKINRNQSSYATTYGFGSSYLNLLILNFPSTVQIIANLTRNYQTVITRDLKYKSLEPKMRQMLKQLSHTLIDLKFYDKFNLMTFCEILRELPLLASLDLSMKLIIDNTIELTEENVPEIPQLKDFKI